MQPEILTALLIWYGKDFRLRPAQDAAIFTHDILANQINTIIATPTNSGKSLLSYLLLLQEAFVGKNVILIEPLRALAYEKAEELKAIADNLKRQSKTKIKVVVSTGDYRTNDDYMYSKPTSPDAGGQIIVATPERLDAISRIKENSRWFDSIALVCLDEAHLIGDTNRGATLEMLIAFLRTQLNAPRLVLMSATIANSNELAQWLAPCNVVDSVPRYPQLSKWVYCIEDGEETDSILLDEIQTILRDPSASVVVFVYQTASAETLAQKIAEHLSGKRIKRHDLLATIDAGVAWFHARLSAATKENIVGEMLRQHIRVVVSTTALSMGVNLPATHVFVRDISFVGYKELDVAELLQMIGRAGRGDTKGTGIVMLSQSNLSKEQVIVAGLTNESMPSVKSQLVPQEQYYGSGRRDLFTVDRFGNQLMGIINRYGTITYNGLHKYLKTSLGGDQISNLQEILEWLVRWKLAYLNEDTNEYELTCLGKVASKCYIPPKTAANMGQLFRDLLQDEPSGKHIAQFAKIDFLIALSLVSDDIRPMARYSRAMECKVNEYMESLPLEEKSYLYRMWITTSPESIYGSSNIVTSTGDTKKLVIQKTYMAMLVYELSRGHIPQHINQILQIDMEEGQEKLIDNALWLLCGMEKVLEVRTFYYHLKTNCEMTPEQVHSVEMVFKRASQTIFGMVADLKYRSQLGEIIRGIKRIYTNAKNYPGEATIKKLEVGGIFRMKDLIGKTVDDLVKIGIKRNHAELITGYIKRRRS